MSTKATKGTVKLVDRSGIYYLDFRVSGKRYRPSTNLAVNPANTKALKQIASRIELDIAMGQFNPDLTHYLATTIKQDAKANQAKMPLPDMFSVWCKLHGKETSDFEETYRFLALTKATYTNVADKLTAKRYAPRTHNRKVQHLNDFFKWFASEYGTSYQPLTKVKGNSQLEAKRKPFTDDELRLILDAIDSDKFCNKYSRVKHSYYADYVRFLFSTGCRPGEIVGLKVQHFDLDSGTVTISESLSKASNYDSRRVQKSTKTGSVRVLPLPDSLIKRLIKRLESLEKTAYVFTGPSGQPIDHSNFLTRVWKPILNGLGIEYRVPYAARHTMASRAIEQGIPITGVAYLMGHADTTMVMKQYGHMINRPNLPTINLEA